MLTGVGRGPEAESCSIRVLGDVCVSRDGARVDLGGRTARRLLAVLVVERGTTVSTDRLCDVLWGDEPPVTAVRTLQSHLSRLRRLLPVGVEVEARPPGYALVARNGSVDADRFEHLVESAPREPPRARATALATALAVFEGAAYGEFADEEWAQLESVRLDELRLVATEEWIDASLAAGDAPRLVGVLEGLVIEHRWRERFWRQLMLALYRCGREPEALRRAAELRALLRDELGLTPTAATTQLEDRMLASDASLLGPGAGAQISVPLPGCFRPLGAPLVARDRMLARLHDARERTLEGRAVTALIGGEAGIGKTRLVSEFAREAAASGAIVIGGQCDQVVGSPYQAWTDALGRLFEHVPVDVAEAVLLYREPAGLLLPERVRRQIPALAPVPAPVGSQPDRRALFDAVARLLAAVSELQPLVVVLDDLHWADAASVLLFRHVSRYDDDARVLLIGTYRDNDGEHSDGPLRDVLADLHREPALTHIALRGLERDETRQLVENLADGPLEDALTTRIYDLTDGNPFFVQQVVLQLNESNRFVLPGPYYNVEWPETIALPEGVRAVVGARVARLRPPVDTLLSIAAVAGRRFDLGSVARMTSDEPAEMRDHVDDAIALGLITPVESEAEQFMFAHALVRAAFLEKLTPLRRADLHELVAASLEAMPLDENERDEGALAYHWFEAARHGDSARSAKALEYALRAAEAACSQFAWEQAEQHAQRALVLLEKHERDEHRRWHAMTLLARVYQHIGDNATLMSTIANACEIARRLDNPKLFARAAVMSRSRDFAADSTGTAKRLLADALERLPATDSAERALVISALLSADVESGRDYLQLEDIEARAMDAREIVDRIGDTTTQLRVYEQLTTLRVGLPGAQELLGHAQRVSLLRRSDDNARLSGPQCEALVRTGQRAEFTRVLEETSRARGTARFVSGEDGAWLTFITGLNAFLDASFEVALEMTERARTTAPHIPSLVHAAADRRMRIAWLQGKSDHVTRELARSASLEELFPQMRALRALIAAERGDSDEAVAIARDLLADNRSLRWNGSRPRILHDLSDVVGLTGNVALAERLHPLLDPYDGEVLCSYLITADGAAATSLGVVESVLGRHDEAMQHFNAALTLEEQLGAPALAATTRVWWAHVLATKDGADDVRLREQLLESAAEVEGTRGVGRLARLSAALAH